MEWLRFTDLERHYGARKIFSGATGALRDGSKVGLVGRNGTGKSSLLRLLAGIDELEGGTLVRARNTRAGYLGQESTSDAKITLRQVIDRAFGAVRAEEERLRELERRLASAAEKGDAAESEALMERYGRAHEAYDHHGGASTERRMRSMLTNLGFLEDDLDRPTAQFSGGQRTRAMLASVLLESPDYLLLDEPTNHLDLETVRWLEDFIAADPRGYIIVSHDRYFLDRVASEIWEIERDQLYVYMPSPKEAYASYLVQRAARLEAAQREYDAWSAEESRSREVIAELRTHGSHNYSHVRSREKQLAKLGKVEAPLPDVRNISVALQASRRMGTGYAFEIKHLAKAFSRPVLTDVSFDIVRGDRIAIVGPNGSGKSTLLSMLAERLGADAGSIRRGVGLTLAYFSQASTDDLGSEGAAVDAVLAAGSITIEEARSLLGAMGLGGDLADKRVDQFSGGERRRIMLARLMAQRADCLLLDEPTNDLDVMSTEALEGVLSAYGGTVVLVSHDRYLLKNVCTRIVMLKDGVATIFDDGYDRYEALLHSTGQTSAATTARPRPRNEEKAARLARSRMQRDVDQFEAEVGKLDRRRAEIELAFSDPQLYEDASKMRELHAELERVKARSLKAVRQWEAALEALESPAT